jgi:hypothetical protein
MKDPRIWTCPWDIFRQNLGGEDIRDHLAIWPSRIYRQETSFKMFAGEWRIKWDRILFGGIQFSNKKELLTCHTMDECEKHNNQGRTPHIVWFHLYKMSRRGKFIKIESKSVVGWGWGWNENNYKWACRIFLGAWNCGKTGLSECGTTW